MYEPSGLVVLYHTEKENMVYRVHFAKIRASQQEAANGKSVSASENSK